MGPDILERALVGKRLLIFDFDGTIADTSPMHAQAFTEVLGPFGITVDYPAIAGLKTADAIDRCFALAGRPSPEPEIHTLLVQSKQMRGRAICQDSLSALPGVDKFLRSVKGNYRLAIASSGSRSTINLALAKLGYDDWFDPVITAEDVSRGKPDPECFQLALVRTKFAAEEALIIEDSEVGFDAARAAGIAFVDASLLAKLHPSTALEVRGEIAEGRE